MKFRCEHCGRQLSIADGQAGKSGRCPRCKQVVVIPAPVVESAVVQADSMDTPAVAPKASLHDPMLFDMPPADATADPQTAEEVYQKLRAMQVGYLLKEREEPPERPLPWIIDIFLYPLNKAGMLILLLCTGIPLLLRALTKFTEIFCSVFPPALVLWVLLIVVHWSVLLLFVLYVIWYATECVRDSAAGGIRAVDTTASTPGLGELFSGALTIIACGAGCMVPAILCAYSRGADPMFGLLYGLGGFLFPMAVLAVILFESLRALNPILLLGSMFSTFLPYCALVPLCCVLCLLFPVAVYYLFKFWILGYLLLFLAFYQLLILAHLLGRFYWRNQDSLNWDT